MWFLLNIVLPESQVMELLSRLPRRYQSRQTPSAPPVFLSALLHLSPPPSISLSLLTSLPPSLSRSLPPTLPPSLPPSLLSVGLPVNSSALAAHRPALNQAATDEFFSEAFKLAGGRSRGQRSERWPPIGVSFSPLLASLGGIGFFRF